MTRNSMHFSKLTLNVNSFNAPIKRLRITNLLKNKTQPYVDYKRLISLKKINTGLESKRLEKSFPSKWTHKQTGVAILISDKVEFRLN
jgi:hypothetical protein